VQLAAAEAVLERQQLGSDPDFQDKLRRGDHGAIGRLREIEKAAMGGVNMIAGVGVDPRAIGPHAEAAANAKQILEREGIVEAYRRVADIGEPIADMIRQNTAVTRAKKTAASQEWERLKSDSEWVQRWLNGNRECRTRKALLDIIKAAPLAD
jgi:hypothetical protein